MPTSASVLNLRNVLWLDAATCALMGTALTLAAAPLGDIAQIPTSLLFYAGLILFPVAAFIAVVAAASGEHRPAVWLIVGGNVLWTVASLVLLVTGWIGPNALGSAFIVVQALVVALLTALEYQALRKGSPGLPSLDPSAP